MFLPLPCPCSFLAFLFAFALREHVDFHWCLMHRFPLNSESIVTLQPCRVQSDVPELLH